MQAKDYTTSIIQTKLHRPSLPVDMVLRPRLTTWLEQHRGRPLTLIAAPAGYGKSTLAQCWLESLDCPTAWVSLDEHDDDLVTFLNYFLAAVQSIFPGGGDETLALIQVTPLPPLHVIVTSLINELAQIKEPFVLVLDDYHQIHTTAIHELLDELLLHPPINFRLVICTRLDPLLSLSRLRAHARITEIRTQDLRLNQDETSALLQLMLGIDVDDATSASLEEQTEGWVTGLRLAALAMRHRVGRERTQGDLTPSNRYVAEYLVSEILAQQISVYSDCMLKISVLERFNADLCQTVCCGDSGNEARKSEGKAFLEWLQASNLFVIPLDDHNQWFRFHHLFREFLLDELSHRSRPEEITGFHKRASQWLAENGYFEEALNHALAANDIERAVQLVAWQRYALTNQSQWHRLERILQKFSVDTIESYPELLMLQTWLIYHFGGWGELPAAIHGVETCIAQSSLPPEIAGYLQAELDALQSLLCCFAIDLKNAMLFAQQSLENTSPEIWIVRVLARSCLSAVRQMEGDLSAAYDAIYQGLEAEKVQSDLFKASLIQIAGIIHWLSADLDGIIPVANQCIDLSRKAGSREMMGYGLYHLGVARYHQNDLKAAEENFTPVVGHPYRNYGENYAYSVCGLASTYLAQNRPDEARQVTEDAVAFLLETRNTTLLPVLQAFQAEIALRTGQVSKAAQWVCRLDSIPPFVFIYKFYAPHLTLAKIWLAQDTPDSRAKADDLLKQFNAFLQSIHNTRFYMEVLALQAMLADMNSDEAAALELLKQAVELAQPGGFIRLFLDLGETILNLLKRLHSQGIAQDYIAQILQAAKPEQAILPTANQRALVEPLTGRELEVLALLSQRFSNKEIAAQLVISPTTVKGHTINIYQKFSVKGRRQAVEKAITLGILLPK